MTVVSIHNSNAELVTRYQKRHDSRAFGELYNRYYEKVFRYCVKLTEDREAALDITQDTFLKVAEHLEDLRLPSTFTAWLFRIARHQCINFLHSRNRRRVITKEEYPEMEAEEIDMDYWLEKERRLTALDSLLDELNEGSREMLRLKYLEDYSVEDLQRKFGISESAVKMRLFRARDRVARLYYQETADR